MPPFLDDVAAPDEVEPANPVVGRGRRPGRGYRWRLWTWPGRRAGIA